MRYTLMWALLLALGVGVYFLIPKEESQPNVVTQPVPQEAVSIIAENLEIPWDIAFLPDGGILVTERTGHLLVITDSDRHEIPVEGVRRGGESGLLGVTLHPNFAQNHFVYVYLSSSQAGANVNRVERYVFDGATLSDKKIIIDNIPGAVYHDGGRMEFGPDGKLYITTGDATRPQIAQDKNSLGGKILRLNDDGSIPSDNPFGTAVWSYGHRNPQGLAWDTEGRLWETEHGPTGEQGLCCRDELNLLAKGGNFGWPTITGDQEKEGMLLPKKHSGVSETWAPASLVYIDGSLYFGGLKGESLYEAGIQGENVVEFKEHFVGQFGRIRTVRVGPDNMLYMTTSNTDGRGDAFEGDDKIIRIDPSQL